MNVNKKEEFDQKKENFMNVAYHREAKWLPILSNNNMGSLGYAGKSYWEVENDYEEFPKAMSKIYEELPADISASDSIAHNGRAYEILKGTVQTRITEDGFSIQHIQNPVMQPEDYPAAIADIDSLVKNVLLPRKMPFLFELDPKDAAKLVIKSLESQTYSMSTGPNSKTKKYVEDNYGIPHIMSSRLRVNTPGDMIFDQFRGFKGTLLDLRRHYQEMKDFCEVMWDKGLVPKYDGSPLNPDGFAGYMAHIPTFLNPKQYEDLCFKYFKQEIEGLAAGGGKLYMLAEGIWKHIIDYFLDLPKDSVMMVLENDDVIEIWKQIGHHQTIGGGAKICDLRLNTKEACIEKAKAIVDVCAGPTSGFVFSTDKAWCCNGDVNQNLIETYKFVRDYAKY